MKEEIKTKKIILFDGICALCNNFIVFVAKNDRKDTFRFLPLQNKNINQYIDTKKNNINYLKSIILIEDGNPKYKSNAAIEILIHLKKRYLLCKIFYIIPKQIRDFIYDLIANNRYKIFGKTENCSILKSKINSEILKNKIISDL